MTFEAAMARLDEIVRKLEKGDAPLQDAMKLFVEGTELSRRCNELLSEAEQQIVKISKGPDGAPLEQEFENAE